MTSSRCWSRPRSGWCAGLRMGKRRLSKRAISSGARSSPPLQLGSSRSATANDLGKLPLLLDGFLLTSLEATYPDWIAEVEKQSDTLTMLRLYDPDDPDEAGIFARCCIDTERSVLLLMERVADGKVEEVTRFSDSSRWLVAGGRHRGRLWTQGPSHMVGDPAISALGQPTGAAQSGGTSRQGRCAVLRQPLVTMRAACAIRAGKGTLEDHFTMLSHCRAIQQWNRVLDHLEAMETIAAGKPGMRWVRMRC